MNGFLQCYATLYQGSITLYEWLLTMLCYLDTTFTQLNHQSARTSFTVDSLYLDYPLFQTSLFLEQRSQSLIYTVQITFSNFSLCRTNFLVPCKFQDSERVHCIYLNGLKSRSWVFKVRRIWYQILPNTTMRYKKFSNMVTTYYNGLDAHCSENGRKTTNSHNPQLARNQ